MASENQSIMNGKIRFFIKDVFSKCDQIPRKQQTWSHLMNKSLMENFIFCTMVTFLIFPDLNFKMSEILRNFQNKILENMSNRFMIFNFSPWISLRKVAC